ncbi:hypothetical protein BC835DRAFT_1310375 [Cytidiella melzeri]|nr:hypothetical protein BC835DRAFT_1310375 [Cytidiella melzeri]
MASYRPLILNFRLWLSLLALLCYCATEVSARSHVIVTSSSKCYDQNNKQIPCPKSKTARLVAIILFSVFGGLFLIGILLYCCGGFAVCAACCCLCCSKRQKKTTAGEVYQVLPEQGNTSTLSSYAPNPALYNYNGSDAPYDPPTAAPPKPVLAGEKYESNTAVGAPGNFIGGGEASAYYNTLPELKYNYDASPAGSKISLPQAEYSSYEPPSYPPSGR